MNTNNQPVTEVTKEASQELALSFLKDFYHEMKREIKRRETTTMRKTETEQYDSVSFLGDTFSLVINFNEKFAV